MCAAGWIKNFFFKLHTNSLEVKTYLEEKGIFVQWGTIVFVCWKPETIENVFLDCWEGYYFWDILRRTLKKDFPIGSYGIRFIPVEVDEGMPLDMIKLLGLHSIWRSRMAARHADENARPLRSYFEESASSVIEVLRTQQPEAEWLPRMEALKSLPKF